MRVRIEHEPDLGQYLLYADDSRAGFLRYRIQGELMAIDHTEIDDRFDGQGLASDLARHVLDEAREEGRGVLPFCNFIRSWMERHPEYLDLIPAEQRPRFGLED